MIEDDAQKPPEFEASPSFSQRRDAARARLDDLFGAKGGNADDRGAWFEAVYETAGDDPAAVPWADLSPKTHLLDWLKANPGSGKTALDVGCGLGDNAEALAAAGYRTAAFDLSGKAIEWAIRRFPHSTVAYRAADLFTPPDDWRSAFDLVHECYTVQALHGDLREAAYAALCDLVAPGGTLLVITRSRPEESETSGPPWPLMPSELARFDALGLIRRDELAYDIQKGDRVIPHQRVVYEKAG